MTTSVERPEKDSVQKLTRTKRAVDVLRKYLSPKVTPSIPQRPDRKDSESAVIDLTDLSLRRIPRSPEDGPPLAKYRRVEIKPILNSSLKMHPQVSSESIINVQDISRGSLAQEFVSTILCLRKPNSQLSSTTDGSSNDHISADFESAGDNDLAHHSLRRTPRSPEDGPPLAKYRRVEVDPILISSPEMRPQILFSDDMHMREQVTSESFLNKQAISIPNPQVLNNVIVIDDSSDEDDAANSESKAQVSNDVIVIDDSSDEDTAADSESNPQISNSIHVSSDEDMTADSESNSQILNSIHVSSDEDMTADSESTPQISNSIDDSSDDYITADSESESIMWTSNETNPQFSNDTIVIYDSSDEDVAASPSIPRQSESQEERHSLQLQNSWNEKANLKYFFERLGFSRYDFLKSSFIENLKKKFVRQREKSEYIRSKLVHQIEELRSKRRAFDRARLEKISQFQLAKCPIYLIDSVEDLMPLTKTHLQRYAELIWGSPHEVLAFKFNQFIKRSDILTLVGSNWLNDEVINFYMNLLIERSEQREGELPSVYAMNTFFLQRLTLSGHAGVSRWTRKIDLFSKDIIPVPVHCGGAHWCMAIIHMRDRTIRYYDSMGRPNQSVLDALVSYLQQESLDKCQVPFDTSGFTIESVQDVPQQSNGHDCGVFSCMFAEYITRNAKINFSQKNMAYFRKRMILEIVDGKLWN